MTTTDPIARWLGPPPRPHAEPAPEPEPPALVPPSPSPDDFQLLTRCPSCRAEPGVQCVVRGGKPGRTRHLARVDRETQLFYGARRAWDEAKDRELTRVELAREAAERRQR